MKRKHLIWMAFVALTAALGIGAPASADVNSMQTRVDYVLANYPGGVQSEWNEVTWSGGDVVLTLSSGQLQARAAVGTCASNKHCVYSGPSQTGSKLTFSTCSNQSVSALGGPVRSLTNARSSGSAQGKNGGTVVLTVAPGTSKNTTATITQVSCT